MFPNLILAMKNKFEVVGYLKNLDLPLDDSTFRVDTQIVGVWRVEAKTLSFFGM